MPAYWTTDARKKSPIDSSSPWTALELVAAGIAAASIWFLIVAVIR